MFQKSDFGQLNGGAPASAWLAGAVALPAGHAKTRNNFRPKGWRARLRAWSDDVNLVPDLGQKVGTLEWYRGIATLAGLVVTAFQLSPGFEPLPGRPVAPLAPAQFEEVRSQMITPLALGGDTGRHMGPTDMVAPLTETPERPQVELSTIVGEGDSLGRSMARAGVSDADASSIMTLLGATIGDLAPGTRLNIVLGRRASRSMPRPLESLTFRARLELAVEITRVDGGLELKKIPIAVDNTPLRIRGRVGESLFRSARAAGAPGSAVQDYLRIIARNIQVSAINPDDMFDIILSHRRAETGESEAGALLYAGLERARGKSLQLLKWTSQGRTDWFEASGVGERRGTLGLPVHASRISSGFGMRRHPLLGYARMHAGIDFAASYGTPIYAAADGRVVYAGWHGGHGRMVKIDHGSGMGTGYAHMSRIAAAIGSRVRRGQVIGYVGSTGLSTGPHLHYELYRSGRPVDPRSVSFTTTSQLVGADLAAFRGRLAQLKTVKAGMPATASASAQVQKDAPQGNGEIALLPNGEIKRLN